MRPGIPLRLLFALGLAAALAGAAGCAGTSPPGPAGAYAPGPTEEPARGSGTGAREASGARRGGVARIDFARLGFLQGYGLLMEGWTDSALVLFQRSLARAEAEGTPDGAGRWGLALAYRLSGRLEDSYPLILALRPSPEPEVQLADGWFSETRGDTAAALEAYARARGLDSTWAPPYLRTARLTAARGDLRAARELLDRAAALGDTLAPRWRAALIPPPPATPAESLLAAAEASPALTRLQWAALLRAHGCPARAERSGPPELIHFRAVRDSLRDLEGSEWVGLALDAVRSGRLEVFPDGSFRGDDVVQRGRFALWLDRFEWPAAAPAPVPDDVPAGDYRRGAVERALAAGLMSPRGPGRFEPDLPMTGREAAEALRRAAEVR
jgi:hypothetical protein